MKLVLTVLVMVICDHFWLMLVYKMYHQALQPLLNINQINDPLYYFPVLLLAYIPLAVGILYFVIPKSKGSLIRCALNGAFLGGVVNVVFQFTNLATFYRWSWPISTIDTLYTMAMVGTISFLVAFFTRKKAGKQLSSA